MREKDDIIVKYLKPLFKYLLLILIGIACGYGVVDANQYYQQVQSHQTFAKNDPRSKNTIGGITNKQRQQLANLNYHSNQSVIWYVNHGRSTLNPKSWTSNRVIYNKLDRQGRASAGNTAFLEQRNHADTSLRTDQYTQPSGWHNNYDGNLVYNRGHLIAYSLTAGINSDTGKYRPTMVGDQDNPQNLFTETDFINQEVQTIYETKARHAIERGEHVIFQATPIFRGNELVPRGINLQAVSTSGKLNFNVYLFNVEPGVRINYQTGNYVYDSQMKIPVPLDAEDAADNTHNDNQQFKFIGNYTRPVATHPRHYIRRW